MNRLRQFWRVLTLREFTDAVRANHKAHEDLVAAIRARAPAEPAQ